MYVRTSGDLQRQQDDDSEPVEHVVDGGCGEGPSELAAVGGLAQGHHRVGHRRPDVGPHHDRDGVAHTQHCRGKGTRDI